MSELAGEIAVLPCPLSAERVAVPEGTTVVCRGDFAGRNNIREVILPEGLQYIRPYTFTGMERLERVNLPWSLKEIGGHAFQRTNVRFFDIPPGVHLPYGAIVTGNMIQHVTLRLCRDDGLLPRWSGKVAAGMIRTMLRYQGAAKVQEIETDLAVFPGTQIHGWAVPMARYVARSWLDGTWQGKDTYFDGAVAWLLRNKRQREDLFIHFLVSMGHAQRLLEEEGCRKDPARAGSILEYQARYRGALEWEPSYSLV